MIPMKEENNKDTWPAIENRWSPNRKEWNLLVRRPFYMNLRLGLTQNALWIGKNTRVIFNRFPLKKAGF